MSAHADTVDILYANQNQVLKYAKNGWLRPIDDLWKKFSAEYNLGDFPNSVLDTYRYEGKLYVIPHTVNVMLFFYRKDLFDQAGKKPPRTIAEYKDLAKFFNTPTRAGTISCQKPVASSMAETHWYMNAIGDGWFDQDWRPIFNSAKGVQAIEALKEITTYAQRGFASAANDECTVALQQDVAAMGLQWLTRAAAMDDAKQSRVVGNIDWVAGPDGNTVLSGDGYAISAFSKQDPEVLFRIIATSSNEANMRGAAALMIPPRNTVLNDPELVKRFRYYPAALSSLKTAKPYPMLPEWTEVSEFIARRVLQALTGEMAVKAALDTAAQETTTLLKSRGYKL
jgi:ABC-type glycerol-3-phosphate transport system substrate-binding protein